MRAMSRPQYENEEDQISPLQETQDDLKPQSIVVAKQSSARGNGLSKSKEMGGREETFERDKGVRRARKRKSLDDLDADEISCTAEETSPLLRFSEQATIQYHCLDVSKPRKSVEKGQGSSGYQNREALLRSDQNPVTHDRKGEKKISIFDRWKSPQEAKLDMLAFGTVINETPPFEESLGQSKDLQDHSISANVAADSAKGNSTPYTQKQDHDPDLHEECDLDERSSDSMGPSSENWKQHLSQRADSMEENIQAVQDADEDLVDYQARTKSEISHKAPKQESKHLKDAGCILDCKIQILSAATNSDGRYTPLYKSWE